MIALAAATWGAYWLPLRHIDGLGLPAAWATFIMVSISLLALIPFQIPRWRRLVQGGRVGCAAGMLAGTSFVLYSNSYAFTTILNVLFLFYLSPIWSTIMARAFLGEAVTPLRVMAIVAGFLGLGIMLGGGGEWPVPRNVGDWMTLSAGILWSAATVVLRKYQGPDSAPLPADEAPGALENTVLFFAGATIGALILPLVLLPDPMGALPPFEDFRPYLPWIFGLALLWWVPTQLMLLWSVPKVSPGRIGILLMAEALFGSITAALFSDEPFGVRQIVGGVLILGAALADTLIGPSRSDVAASGHRRRPSAGGTEKSNDLSLGRLRP
jgi:drug/metabolite transporter (DMT)-like permease